MLEPVLLRVVTVVIATLQVMYVVQFKHCRTETYVRNFESLFKSSFNVSSIWNCELGNIWIDNYSMAFCLLC